MDFFIKNKDMIVIGILKYNAFQKQFIPKYIVI